MNYATSELPDSYDTYLGVIFLFAVPYYEIRLVGMVRPRGLRTADWRAVRVRVIVTTV